MTDIIEKYHGSLVQHGKDSDRVYLMKLNQLKVLETLEVLEELALKNKYTKILAKIPVKHKDIFKLNDYSQEAYIPGFFKGIVDGVFMSRYLDQKRSILKKPNEINEIIELSGSKDLIENLDLPCGYSCDVLNSLDIPQIVELYKKVFKAYPFPIFDQDYIDMTMKDNVCYFGIKNKEGKLVAVSSSEMDKENLNSEMTDYATDPDYRGYGFALFLLKVMEEFLINNNYKTAYTIARAESAGMNITFAKNGYKYSGTLVNNSNIFSGIESMNVWYKNLV